ncbi:hypothetical protein HHK36_001246 [Tetracentron sinense]|uniref:BAG domain-containing protein n=1 Tax=Tetracentron sinense TaxID=13715 RepID=A0A834ZTC9_TETSI|nr:hypothetical protein HHK36_001246 [Tetracentron sinense]
MDAAVRIQSACRGFEVRKWQPMKKLRQLTRIRAQVDEGLHPSLRDIRKSVARELIFLQEKLDSLANQKSCVPASTGIEEDPAVEAAMEDICKTVHDNRYMPPEVNEEQIESGPAKDLSPDSKVEEVVEPLLVDKEIQADSGRELTEQPAVGAEEQESKAAGVELKGDVIDEMSDHNPKEMVEVQRVSDTPKSMPEKCPEPPLVVEKIKSGMKLMEPSVDNDACDLEVRATCFNTENVEIVSGKHEEILLKGDNGDDSKLAELIVLPTEKEKSREEELIEVFKPEEPVNIQPSEGTHAEKPKDVFENSDACSPVDSLPTPESTSSEEVMAMPIKESKVYNSIKPEAETANEKEESQESEAMTCKDRMVEWTCGSGIAQDVEIAQDAVIIGTGSDSASADPAEEEGDLLFKASNSRSSLVETEEKGEYDKKLIEENEKLREMVVQLIQKGKEKLTVISALNERVRDLEKMRRKKKLRVRPQKATAVKPSNNLSTALV